MLARKLSSLISLSKVAFLIPYAGIWEPAWELRSQTTMPLAWTAERLHMGSRGHLAWLLQRRGKSWHAAPADQCVLGI